MASGDTLVTLVAQNALFGISSVQDAQFTTRNGIPCISFDDSTDEDVHFACVLPNHYTTGAAVSIFIHWAAATDTTTSRATRWLAAIQAFTDGGVDLDTVATLTPARLYSGSVPSVSGDLDVGSASYSSGDASGNELTAGAYALIRIVRDADSGSDTTIGDAQLFAVTLREA